MQIKVWGCRGSLPTPGKETVRYGGNTTCLEIRLRDGTLIVVDAGSGIRALGEKLLKDPEWTEMYLVLTHAHWDHLMGFPFFRPSFYSKYRIHVRGGPRAKRSLRRYLEHQMERPYFPVPFSAVKAAFDFTSAVPRKKTLGTAEISFTRLNHLNGGYGLKIVEQDKTFVFLTDNELDFAHQGGLTKENYVDFGRGADLLMHDAQYTEEEYTRKRGWGHSTFSSATHLAIQAGVKQFGLFHHDPEHSDDDIDGFVDRCRKQCKQTGSSVDCFGVWEGLELSL